MPPLNSFFASFLTKKGPTVKAMQDVLRTIGEATSGTKDVLQTRLLTRLPLNRIPHTVVNNNRERTRILSIDMGLKNLAYCVAEVQYSTPTLATTNMDIFSWRRIDLSEAYREYSLSGDQKSLENEALMEGRESEDLYTPESLSRMAYWFLNKVLSESHPNVILIERQRWRSAGSPTIQQWTVRVNTLEAAMWAILTTLRYEKALQVDWGMKAVDPKRVGHFWLDGVTPTPPPSGRKKTSVIDAEKDAEDDEEADKEGKRGAQKLSRSKAEKKAKIQLLRSWLNSDNPSTTLSTSNPGTEVFTPNISFTFSERHRVTNSTGYGAEGTRQALLYATDSPSERLERNAYNKAYVKKVDDITDCFLQAVAWVAWAVNRRSLGPQVRELQAQIESKLGRGLPIPHKHLPEAVKELQERSKKVAENEDSSRKVTKKTSRAKKAKTLEGEEVKGAPKASKKASKAKGKASTVKKASKKLF